MIRFTISTVLGETREVSKLYAWEVDGIQHVAYNCPFCASAVTTERNMVACENPWCLANPALPVETARKMKAVADAKTREESERKRNHERAMIRIKEDNDRRVREYQDWTMKVRAANGCVSCSDQYRGKIRKHRLECPKIRNAA